jgi:uncharacterized protein with NRDE domain
LFNAALNASVVYLEPLKPMCLIIFAHRCSPDLPLIVTANRDEFHQRPTRAAQFWSPEDNLLAGQDLEQGGTWMGLTRSGRFAAITNVRDPISSPTPQGATSRGEVSTHFLQGQSSPLDYIQQLAGNQYTGFNLLLGDGKQLVYWSNRLFLPNGDYQPPKILAAGIYGLSNAALDTPWPKVQLGKRLLATCITSNKLSHDDLAAVVGNSQQADSEALQQLGLTSPIEQALSSQFIRTADYGTRATTSLIVNSNKQVDWRERSFNTAGEASGDQRHQFSLLP